jgi:3-hydroxybutyryl-CoA dehydrogenase
MTFPQTVGVIGAGTMGTGIAQTCALAGISVVLIDVDEKRVANALESMAGALEKLIKKDKLTAAQREAALGRLRGVREYAELRGCDFIIEAATENEALKLQILRQVDEVASDQTVVATNTSSISIGKLGAAMARPDAFIGLHFFNPVPVMGLVEVVTCRNTAKSTLNAAVELAKRLGKTPVVVNDSPGFVVNRLLCPLLNEAVFAYAGSVASARDIDEAMKLGCNHPTGPLALCDLIGLDVVLAIMEVLQRDFGDAKYRPAPLLREMVAAGHLGRKTGRGFYEYETRH